MIESILNHKKTFIIIAAFEGIIALNILFRVNYKNS